MYLKKNIFSEHIIGKLVKYLYQIHSAIDIKNHPLFKINTFKVTAVSVK